MICSERVKQKEKEKKNKQKNNLQNPPKPSELIDPPAIAHQQKDTETLILRRRVFPDNILDLLIVCGAIFLV